MNSAVEARRRQAAMDMLALDDSEGTHRKTLRFAANPVVVDGPHTRFYAGAPLRYRGHALYVF